MRLLSMREHSRFELGRKLSRKFDRSIVEQTLQNLDRQGLQSDERFAEQYVYFRRNKGYGPLRIRSELSEKGIAHELIGRWLDDDASDWQSLMQAVAEKKFGGQPAPDQKEMAKRGRFLSSRGFTSWMINDYLFG